MDTKEYRLLLNDFATFCKELIDRGTPYFTVLLCHELYRFLYPQALHVRFANKDPISFITNHIRQLLRLGWQFEGRIRPYPIDFKTLDKSKLTVEEETSELYSGLWRENDFASAVEESSMLLRNRIPQHVIDENIKGKAVLDLGCGSGRYSIALAKMGAERVIALDFDRESFLEAEVFCREKEMAVGFCEQDVLNVFGLGNYYGFVFCNGVLHHTESIEKGLKEIHRVLKDSGRAFLYLYATGGIFWHTRKVLREIFKKVPIEYTKSVFRIMNVPGNRFVFLDTWYAPIETHTSREDLHGMLDRVGFKWSKIIGGNESDLDKAIDEGITGAEEMWGEGEHRYILEKEE